MKQNNLLKGLIDKQREKKNKNTVSVNLEALVNSGRVRIAKDKLEEISDKSKERKNKLD